MVKELDGGLEVSEFEIQLHYHAHFQNSIRGKRMTPYFSPSYRENIITAVLQA